LGVIAQDLRQAVERHTALQVVDVMHADVGAEPAQDAGQYLTLNNTSRSPR